MVVRLIFDSRISYVYVPDGYITDAKSLRCSFLEWVLHGKSEGAYGIFFWRK